MINKRLLQQYQILKERLYKHFSKYHHIEHLEGPRILVLAPHPDDDVFGCGGTLIRHVEQGHQVQIVYLCKGDKGISGVKAASATAIRKEEAVNAAHILGIPAQQLFFFEQADNELKATEKIIQQLRDIIQTYGPNLIYLPSFLDLHPDHIQTNWILKKTELTDIKLCAYEIWTPFIPNRIVDISQQIEGKKRAMEAHESQLQALNYKEAILGLNQYRAQMYTKKQMAYAETFLYMDIQAYFQLWKTNLL